MGPRNRRFCRFPGGSGAGRVPLSHCSDPRAAPRSLCPLPACEVTALSPFGAAPPSASPSVSVCPLSAPSEAVFPEVSSSPLPSPTPHLSPSYPVFRLPSSTLAPGQEVPSLMESTSGLCAPHLVSGHNHYSSLFLSNRDIVMFSQRENQLLQRWIALCP